MLRVYTILHLCHVYGAYHTTAFTNCGVINTSVLCNLWLSFPLIKLGELGKGAGKGGGGGGSVREAGGAFGKKQAAEEEMYFK